MPVRKSKLSEPATLSGITLALWRKDSNRVGWARQNEMFREIIALVTNERINALIPEIQLSEGRALGRTEGYQLAVNVLSAMAQMEDTAKAPIEQTYEKPEEFKE